MNYLPFTRPSIDEETIAGVVEVLRSGWITTGPCAAQLEQELSQYFGGRQVRAMSSATGALEVALAVAGVQPGDEVITTPLSWVATANVIVRAGARPVFVDVDARTRNIDLECIEAAITPRTRALLPVDMAGLPVDRDRLYELARRHGLRVIEDAAQGMGASWRGQRIGSFGDLVAISFHANKNITTAEGGCLVLTDPAEAELCARLRLQGVVRMPDGNQEVEVAGGKHNLTDIAARIGLGQLKHLEAFTARRRALAR
ncbi:MAG: DegT/DnrJ/EryC1/StrS aminotransferase family protein, partial [Pseudomonadota bacterium]